MKRKICGTIAALAFVWLLGVAGSSDLGLNTTKDIIWQGGAARRWPSSAAASTSEASSNSAPR